MKRRPVPYVVETRPGFYELWFGKWVLLGGTNFERLDDLRRLMTV